MTKAMFWGGLALAIIVPWGYRWSARRAAETGCPVSGAPARLSPPTTKLPACTRKTSPPGARACSLRYPVFAIAMAYATIALAQSDPAVRNTFEVASVSLSKGSSSAGRGSLSGGPGTPDPGHLICKNFSLEELLIWSYRIKRYQLTGPSWMRNKTYDIVAKIPVGATMAETHVMLQNLLIERLQMRVRHEVRELPGYEIRVAKSGLKMKEAASEMEAAAPPSRVAIMQGADGLPVLPPGRPAMKTISLPNGLTRVMARMVSIPILMNVLLSSQLGASPVADKTGLMGKYDFTLDFDPNAFDATPPDTPPVTGPDLISALREQLGLQLVPKHVPVDVLVVDEASERPVEN